MDMRVVRQEAKEMGPLRGDVKRNRRGEALADIPTVPENIYTLERLVPTPLWDGDSIHRNRDGSVLYYHQPTHIRVRAYNTPHAVRLVDGPERHDDGMYEEGGVYEKVVRNAWAGYEGNSRPWRTDSREGVAFTLIEMENAEVNIVDFAGED